MNVYHVLVPGLGTEGNGTLEKTGSSLLSCRKPTSHPVNQYFPGVEHGTGVELVNAVREGQGGPLRSHQRRVWIMGEASGDHGHID